MTRDPVTRDPLEVVKLVIAWTVVGAPLLWGISQVIKQSLALFR
jgi:hypothetical protein